MSKMFRTQFDKRERVIENPGCRERVLYMSKVADDGNIELVPSGTEDLYASIQSHKDSCDIHVILTRFANGDTAALSKQQGSYGDFTQLPNTYAGLLNAVIAGENYFNSLPLDIRSKFDHSFEKFMVAMDDMPKFLDMLGVAPQSDQQSGEPGGGSAGDPTSGDPGKGGAE